MPKGCWRPIRTPPTRTSRWGPRITSSAASRRSSGFFLHFKGISGDKRRGLEQLEIAALKGHYLRPFAKMLLALAALREKKYPVARIQLMELVDEFPQNPL